MLEKEEMYYTNNKVSNIIYRKLKKGLTGIDWQKR